MAYTRIGSDSAVGAVTVNSTGATFIVIVSEGEDGRPAPTENKGNVAATLADSSAIAGGRVTIHFLNPDPAKVGANHTFVCGGSYGSIGVILFSGGPAALVASGHGESTSALTQKMTSGVITPPVANALAVWAGDFGNTFADIDSGFGANAVAVTGVYGVNYGVFGGSKTITDTSTLDPTVTQTVPPSRMQFVVALFLPPGGPAATVTSATVAANGNELVLGFSASVASAAVTVAANGHPIAVAGSAGSGTAWTVNFGRRWINLTDSVTVTYGGVTYPVTNGSLVKGNQIAHVGRGFSAFICFQNITFLGLQIGTGAESPNSFAPSGDPRSFVRQWAAACKLAGMNEAVLTAKHHDGFCLWPSASSNYNLSASNWWVPAGRPDLVRIFVEEFRAAGLGASLYVSVADKHWEAAHPGYTQAQYTAFVVAQLTELLTNYGPIDAIWLDAWPWMISYAYVPWASVKAVRDALQPTCLIVTNNYEGNLDHSDLLCWEFPAQGNPALGNKLVGELCDTIELDSVSSGYNWFHAPTSYLGLNAADVRAKVAYHNANNFMYRLNIPPDTTGFIPAATMAVLAEAGSNAFERSYEPRASLVATNPIAVGVDIVNGHLVIPA